MVLCDYSDYIMNNRLNRLDNGGMVRESGKYSGRGTIKSKLRNSK